MRRLFVLQRGEELLELVFFSRGGAAFFGVLCEVAVCALGVALGVVVVGDHVAGVGLSGAADVGRLLLDLVQ